METIARIQVSVAILLMIAACAKPSTEKQGTSDRLRTLEDSAATDSRMHNSATDADERPRNPRKHAVAWTESDLADIAQNVARFVRECGVFPGAGIEKWEEELAEKYPFIRKLGYYRQHGREVFFADSWERPVRLSAASPQYVYSIGPNGVDEGGSGDDIYWSIDK